jgi:hypothetical protein
VRGKEAVNLRDFGQPWILAGERSSLLTHIAATARRLRIQVSGRMVWIDQIRFQKG